MATSTGHRAELETNYLGRYRMSLAMRIPLELLLAAGAAIGMNARLGVIAVKA